jgi:Tfp pilus assembly major pilin PilA
MNTKKRQLGLSVWGILGVIIVVLIVFWIAIEVVPEYMAASTIDSCLQDSQAGANGNESNLKSHFANCLNQNAIYDFSDYDLKMQGKSAVLTWQVKKSLFGNASLLLDFNKQAPE